MYKRLVSALLLLVLCFALSAVSYKILEKRTTEISTALSDACVHFEKDEFDEGLTDVQAAVSLWKENETVYGIFLNHAMLEQLNSNIPSLLPLAESKSKKDTLSVIEQCISALDSIMDEQKISIENIL